MVNRLFIYRMSMASVEERKMKLDSTPIDKAARDVRRFIQFFFFFMLKISIEIM